ncbi:MAG: T9SS C-terminal target domain-containing protein, partial [Calditrichaeota bacterium]
TRIAAFQPNNLPPLVDITVTPQPGDPVIVPPGGLVFDYDVTVDNNGSTTLNAQIWNTVSLPTGEEVGPFPKAIFPQSITVPAGGTFSGTFTMEVPSRVRPNTYTFNMKVGTFPNVQLDRDTFTIIKTPGPATSEVAGGADGWEPVVVASSAKPERFVLDQNYPNPFNPSTVIRYGLPEATHVKLTVYNTLGQRVATLVDGYQSAGFKTVKWDGRDSSGHTVSAGIYVYRLEAGDRVLIKKMAFTK